MVELRIPASVKSFIGKFDKELVCTYRGESYRVRDNGAIFREPKPEARKRPLDGKWTFGNLNPNAGYPLVAGVPVHRIVATAFHGEQPSEDHVVDHIDTNRRNNRPENLRWVTRLENVLLNPITAKRVIQLYGSFEAFFADPSNPQFGELREDFSWMKAVSKEQADTSRARLLEWAKSDQMPKGGALGDWVFGTQNATVKEQPDEPTTIPSETAGALQRKWKTPTSFPQCPDPANSSKSDDQLLEEYELSLSFGMLFAKNRYSETTVVASDVGETGFSVLGHMDGVKDWTLTRVTLEDGAFVHESLGTFFSLEGAVKQYCASRGVAWTESIDDYA